MLNSAQQNGKKKGSASINTIVIESHENDICEYGLSFTNSNPEQKDYFPMLNKETAYKLQKYLAEYAPIS